MKNRYYLTFAFLILTLPFFSVVNAQSFFPKDYDSLLVGENHFIVKKGGKTILFDSVGNVKFPEIASIQPSFEGPLNHEWMTYFVKNADSKCGLLDWKFRPLLPMIYDSISLFSYYDDSILKGQVYQDGKSGIFGSRYKLVIPLIYDDLKLVYSSYHAGFSGKNWFFAYKLHGKYGILDGYGNKLTEAVYTLPNNNFSPPEDEVIFVLKGNDLFAFSDNGKTSQQLDYQFTRNAIDYYRWKDQLVPLHTTGKEFTEVTGKYHDNLVFLSDQTGPHLCDSKGNEFFPDKISTLYHTPLPGHCLVFITKSHHIGVINSLSGKLILDTMHRSISDYGLLKNEICLGDIDHHYFLYDTLGRKLLSVGMDWHTSFITFSENNASKLRVRKVIVDQKIGVIDSNYRFILEPHFENIGFVYPNHLAVITPSKRTGLFDLQGNRVIDTIYTDFLPVFDNYHYCMDKVKDLPNFERRTYYLFRKGEQRVLIDQLGNQLVSANHSDQQAILIDSILYESSLKAHELGTDWNNHPVLNFVPDGSLNVGDGAFKPFGNEEEKVAFANFPCKKELYDILKANYERNLPFPISHLGIGFRTHFSLVEKPKESYNELLKKDIGSRYFSLLFNRMSSESHHIGQMAENYLLDPQCHFRKVEFGDIFSDPKGLVKEVEKAFQKRSADELRIGNLSPAELVHSIRNFTLSRQGIVLYLENPDFLPFELLIPKENLQKHKSTKWICPYLN